MTKQTKPPSFVRQFRASAPYINAFRNRTFVVYFGGEAIVDPLFPHLIQDLALLHSLGIRLVLIHGVRPQIKALLGAVNSQFVDEIRVTDETALAAVKAANGSTRMEIEALFSASASSSPIREAGIPLVSGNFITAKPYGIRDGVDFLYTGEFRRIDTRAINQQLEKHAIVLLSAVGYSPTGEIFNLFAEDVAFETAKALAADKLLCLFEGDLIKDSKRQLVRELSFQQVDAYIASRRNIDVHTKKMLLYAMDACSQGVHRVHFLNHHIDGCLLQELFTRDGVGSLISAAPIEGTRAATIEDVPGILALISPLEEAGILVRRSREKLEMEIANFTVVERDGMIIACAALYYYKDQLAAELACLAVDDQYQNAGRGDVLLKYLETRLKQEHIEQLYVLSTRTSHWFIERGFNQADINALPLKRKLLYNYQRNSKIFIKNLTRSSSNE